MFYFNPLNILTISFFDNYFFGLPGRLHKSRMTPCGKGALLVRHLSRLPGKLSQSTKGTAAPGTGGVQGAKLLANYCYCTILYCNVFDSPLSWNTLKYTGYH